MLKITGVIGVIDGKIDSLKLEEAAPKIQNKRLPLGHLMTLG
jgi:hypothetical protein